VKKRSLIETVQGLLERTYAMERHVEPIERFVIGDRGFRLLYGTRIESKVVASADGQGARTLVRETDDGVRACIYFPDAMIRSLEHSPPQRGLGDRNVDAFAVLVEEIDHLLCIAERVHQGRRISMFELELHANVSKFLVLSRFLAAGRPRLGPRRRLWLDYHLFRKSGFVDDDPDVRERYQDAGRWARRFVEGCRTVPFAERTGLLRRFHRADTPGKIGIIESLRN